MPLAPNARRSWFSPRLQFILAFGLLTALLATVFATSLLTLSRIRSQHRQAIDVDSRLSEIASQIANQTLLCRRYEKDLFLNLRDPESRQEYLAKWHTAFADLQQSLAAFDRVSDSADNQAQLVRWKTDSAHYHTAFLNVTHAIMNGTITTSEAANGALAPAKDAIRILTDTALGEAERKAATAQQTNMQLGSTITTGAYLVIGLGTIALIVALGWSWIFLSRLIRPIDALRRVTYDLAQGDLAARVPVFHQDELGQLAASINDMAALIQQRTSALESQHRDLQESYDRQRYLLETVKQLSTPLLPLTDEIVVLPIVGHVDTIRAKALTETLLHGVAERNVHVAILDVSGIVAMDSHVMGLLLQTTQAVQLMGVTAILAGISALMAHVLVEEGISLGQLQTYRTLQAALEAALNQSTLMAPQGRSATLLHP